MNVLVINHCVANKGDAAVLYFILRELVRSGIKSIAVSAYLGNSRFPPEVDVGAEVRFVPSAWESPRLERGKGMIGRALRAKDRSAWRAAYRLVRELQCRSVHVGLERIVSNRAFSWAVKQADLVVSTGGHHVTTLLERDAVSRQVYDMAVALLAGKPLVLWSQSIGPLDFFHPANREFVHRLLSEAAAIYVRDTQSLEQLARLSVTGNVHRTYESVLGLHDALGPFVPPSERAAVVGISLYATKARSEAQRAEYAKCLAALVDHVAGMGYHVRFFPMGIKASLSDDRPMIAEVIEAAHRRGQCSVVEEDLDTLRHILEVAKCRLFVGHKTHSTIFALAVGTPLLALAYHRKTEDFMRQYGFPQHCIPDEELTAGNAIRVLDTIESSLDEVGKQEFERTAELGEIVRNDFQEMVGRFAVPS